MRRLFPIVLTLFAVIACAHNPPAEEAVWIDVRSATEYNSGHLEGALNIPHTEIADQIATVTEDRNAVIYLYCRSGGRAGIAKEALEKQGYSQVVNVGGLNDALAKTGQQAVR